MFQDSHGIEERNASPVTDDSQDVEVLGGVQNETHTIIDFSRKWHTCDPQDRQLTVSIRWSINHCVIPPCTFSSHQVFYFQIQMHRDN